MTSDNYVEVIVDVGVVTIHLFSPVSACGMLCELTLNETDDCVWIRCNITRLIMITSASSLLGE